MPVADRKVAVIAIHGVGKHPTGSSATDVADLLVGMQGRVAPPARLYSDFSIHESVIPLPDASLFLALPKTPPPPSFWSRLAHLFQEHRGFFGDKNQFASWFVPARRMAVRAQLAQADIANEFTKVLLQDYEGDRETNSFSAYRLDGQRSAEGGHPPTDVHVYDMHWSDLSRPSNSVLRFFMAFYQLLLHIASLGRTAIDQAALEHIGQPGWFLFQRFYTYASRILTLVVSNLLAVFPVVALAPLPLLLGAGTAGQAITSAVIFAGVMTTLLVLSQRRGLFGGHHWFAFSVVTAAVVSGALTLLLFQHVSLVPLTLTIEWWLGAILVLGRFVFPKYDEVRNGALQAGWAILLIVAGAFSLLVYLGHGIDPVHLRRASFDLLQYLLLAVRIFWVLFIVCALLAFVFERICRLGLSGAANKDALARARAAARTGRLTLAVPTVLLMLITIFLWSGIYRYVEKRANLFEGVAPGHVSLVPGAFLDPDQTEVVLRDLAPGSVQPKPASDDANRYFEGLLLQSAYPGLPFVVGLSLAALLLLVLTVLPSVFCELSPPVSGPNQRARLLGTWLTSGLDSFRIITALSWMAAFATPFVYMLVVSTSYYLQAAPRPAFFVYLYEFWGMSATHTIVNTAGALFAGSAAMLAGLLLKYGSVVLDTILDVDNYLRGSPKNNTPRARIVERYLALLRHLHLFRDEQGRPYERIVIIAHSLGALISADLLRYLRFIHVDMAALKLYAFGDREESLPLYFFSMGNPLRQLLNRFFPNLYRWIRERPDGAGEEPVPSAPVTDTTPTGDPIFVLPPDRTPPASQLGVRLWRNSYRSGDYIGRSIWVNDVDHFDSFPGVPLPVTSIESCIGLGAHTHYWDRSAPDIARELDSLIVV